MPSVDGYALDEGKIINTPVEAYELPESGGPGTKLFYGLGISFVGFAGLLLFIKRRELRDLSKRRW
jgi:LPXTG-motif cell wall-anchored protein